jgi:hypothetical protein
VVNINVTGWTYPSSLADARSPYGSDAGAVQTAVDEAGDAIVVWDQMDTEGNSQIYRSEFRNGEWTDPLDLSDHISPDYASGYRPRVAMDNNGNSVIVWHGYEGDSSNIYIAEYRNASWTEARVVSSKYCSASETHVAMGEDGSAMIAWEQDNAVLFCRYLSGEWSSPSELECFVEGSSRDSIQVAMNDAGDAVVAWRQLTQYPGAPGYEYQIFKREYRGHAWTPPSAADCLSPSGVRALVPRVAMDNSGDIVMAWLQEDESDTYQIFRGEKRGGVWILPAGLSDHVSPDGPTATFSTRSATRMRWP